VIVNCPYRLNNINNKNNILCATLSKNGLLPKGVLQQLSVWMKYPNWPGSCQYVPSA
jgi:hypothetical protein